MYIFMTANHAEKLAKKSFYGPVEADFWLTSHCKPPPSINLSDNKKIKVYSLDPFD
jgi:hypothetical protein